MSSIEDRVRSPTIWERRLLARLLEASFSGRDELKVQIETLSCRVIDANGSLDLQTSSPLISVVKKRVPVEGAAKDLDGMTIHYLLHVKRGFVNELEIYKDDSSRVLHRPEPAEVEVVTAE